MKKILGNKKYTIAILGLIILIIFGSNIYFQSKYIESCPKNKVASRWDLFKDGTKKIKECSKPLTCSEGHFIETQCSVREYQNKQGEEYYECFTYCRKEGGPPIF